MRLTSRPVTSAPELPVEWRVRHAVSAVYSVVLDPFSNALKLSIVRVAGMVDYANCPSCCMALIIPVVRLLFTSD